MSSRHTRRHQLFAKAASKNRKAAKRPQAGIPFPRKPSEMEKEHYLESPTAEESSNDSPLSEASEEEVQDEAGDDRASLAALVAENRRLRDKIRLAGAVSKKKQQITESLNTSLLTKISDSLSNSLSSNVEIKIEPCEPSDNKEISTADWEYWKTAFEAWLDLTKIVDPMKQQNQFMVKAGRKLVTALTTAPEIKESTAAGWELTKEKLNNVYNTRANSFSLQRDFRMLTQREGEKNVNYLSRVMSAAMLIWKKDDPKLDEEITLVVAIHSNSPRLQEFASTSSGAGANNRRKYDELVEKARVLDGVLEINQKIEKVDSTPALLAVEKSSYTPKNAYGGNRNSYQGQRREERQKDRGRYDRERDNRDTERRSYRGEQSQRDHDRRPYREDYQFRDRRGNDFYRAGEVKRFRPNERPCFHCSGAHDHWKCDKAKEPCANCKIIGHTAEVCRSRIRYESIDSGKDVAGKPEAPTKPKEV